jgi:hypothetical protein
VKWFIISLGPDSGIYASLRQAGFTQRRLSFRLRFAASPRHDPEAGRINTIYKIDWVFQFPACLAIASAKLRRLDETEKSIIAFGEKKIVHYIGCTQKNTDSVESGTDPGEMAFNFTPVPSVGATGQAGWATEFDGFFQL